MSGRPFEAVLRSPLLAIVPVRDEEPSLPAVLAALPPTACGMRLGVLVVDDGSRDRSAELAAAAGAAVVSHPRGLGLGAALRTGLGCARAAGCRAAVYLDGDGEYDAREAELVLEPIVAGRADYTIGSRFLGLREGMARHRAVTNRALSAAMTALTGVRMTDSQSGYRAFSARALGAARIRHDYNYAQVLTLSLWGAGIEPVEVPIAYRRRAHGRSFVRHGRYLRAVAPAMAAEYAAALGARRRRAAEAA